jgi:hypothetical protein
MAGDLGGISSTDDERLGTQLLAALINHFDALAGLDRLGVGANLLLQPAERALAAEEIQRIRATSDRLRLTQPVDAAVTLDEGRQLAGRLAVLDDWQANVGRALIATYAYLDQLYGGPEAFTELLSPDECAAVARTIGPEQPAPGAATAFPACSCR